MKKKSKMLIVIVLVIVCACTQITDVYAGEPTISYPSSKYASCIGYTQRHDLYVKYNGKKVVGSYQVKKGTAIGVVHYYVGRYRLKNKVDKKYYDAMFTKINMEPKRVYGYNSKNKKKAFYGFSQYVSVSSNLPKKICTIQNTTPNNSTTGSSSYSVGISGGYKSASLSGSVSIPSKYCKVADKTSVGNEYFGVSFDYKPTWNIVEWPSTSERSRMLFSGTWQMATCEWSANKSNYTVSLKIYGKFGLSSSKSGGGIYTPMKGYSSGNTSIISCSYKKGM